MKELCFKTLELMRRIQEYTDGAKIGRGNSLHWIWFANQAKMVFASELMSQIPFFIFSVNELDRIFEQDIDVFVTDCWLEWNRSKDPIPRVIEKVVEG